MLLLNVFYHVRGPDKVLVSDDISRAVKPATAVHYPCLQGVSLLSQLCSSPIPMALASCGRTIALSSVQRPHGKSCFVTSTNAPCDENAATLFFDDRVDSRRSIPSHEARVYNRSTTAWTLRILQPQHDALWFCMRPILNMNLRLHA